MTKLQQTLHYLHVHRTVVFVLLTLFVFILGFINFNKAEAPETVEPLPDKDITISITIADKYANNALVVSEGDTLLDALAILDATEPELQLNTTYYEGLGALITSMYGMENGTDNNYWQYEVNGVMPQIGASAYELQENDAIYWKFSASEY